MIHHVTREVPPSVLEDCLEFYALLGFEPVPVPDGIAGRAVWLERAGTQIHLMPTPGAQPEQGHVAVVLAPYPETLARLGREGYEVEARRQHWGSPRAHVRDPAGHLVELLAWAPGEAPPVRASPESDCPAQQPE